jgi:flagellar biosynthesis GTPase FlhF
MKDKKFGTLGIHLTVIFWCRSFVPPVRDEESETQRKAHAKRVRETRRSTQGVTLEEIKVAEQLVKKKNQQQLHQATQQLSNHEQVQLNSSYLLSLSEMNCMLHIVVLLSSSSSSSSYSLSHENLHSGVRMLKNELKEWFMSYFHSNIIPYCS